MGNRGERLLLLRERHPFEDTVVAAANTPLLISCEVYILRDDNEVDLHEASDAADRVVDCNDNFGHKKRRRSLDNRMAYAVAHQNLNRDFGVGLYLIGNVYDRAGNPVCDFVRVGRIYFLNHGLSSFALFFRSR